jgi:hypothetical protein
VRKGNTPNREQGTEIVHESFRIAISKTANSWFIAFAYEQEHKAIDKQYEIVGVDLDTQL